MAKNLFGNRPLTETSQCAKTIRSLSLRPRAALEPVTAPLGLALRLPAMAPLPTGLSSTALREAQGCAPEDQNLTQTRNES